GWAPEDIVDGRPHWLSRLIESRYERLSAGARIVAATSSIIGLLAPRRLLETLIDSALTHDLVAGLAAADLLYGVDDEVGLRFKHGITRDVIYELAGFEQRRGLHLRIAEILEERVRDDSLDEQFEPLAHHYRLGGHLPKAIDFAERA